jgi:regulator of RNase E activity RraA
VAASLWTEAFAISMEFLRLICRRTFLRSILLRIGNVMLTGINVPVRISGMTVMPGDLVVGDREDVYFIPPRFVQEVLDRADETHIHDEWTKRKFDEGKYKSSQIYRVTH